MDIALREVVYSLKVNGKELALLNKAVALTAGFNWLKPLTPEEREELAMLNKAFLAARETCLMGQIKPLRVGREEQEKREAQSVSPIPSTHGR